MDASETRRLCALIVLRAAMDYRRAWKRNDRRALAETERFFRSGWFEMINPIPELSGEEMMKRIRENLDLKLCKELEEAEERMYELSAGIAGND